MAPPDYFYAQVILNLLFVSGAWCLARPSAEAAVVLTLVSGLWLVGNGPLEGHVLWSYSSHHGVTVSDFLSVAGVAIAALTVWRTRPPTRRSRHNLTRRRARSAR